MEIRSIILEPHELGLLDQVADRDNRARAAYCKKAIMDQVARDLSKRGADIQRILEEITHWPENIQSQAIDLVAAINAHAREKLPPPPKDSENA